MNRPYRPASIRVRALMPSTTSGRWWRGRSCATLLAALGCASYLAPSTADPVTKTEEVRIGELGATRVLEIEGSKVSTVALVGKTEIKTRAVEFVLTVASEGRESVITPSECSPETLTVRPGDFVDMELISQSPALQIGTFYTPGHKLPYLFKSLRVTNRGSKPVRILRATADKLQVAGVTPMRGGVGQPVTLANEFFLGFEHPAALNQVQGDEIALTEFPDAELAPGASWSSDNVVLGAAKGADESVEDAFTTYLISITRRGPKFRALYCDWAAHDEMGTLVKPQLTEALTFKLLDALESMKKEWGVAFDDYTLDAFWFDPRGAYLSFKQPNWPRGFGPALERIRKLNLVPGLWFDLGGGTLDLAHTPGWKGPEHPCLSDPEFAGLIEKALEAHIREHGLALIEFDFANLGCTHTSGIPALAAMKKNADALALVVRVARAANPAVVIRAYNTFSSVPIMESTNLYDEAYPVSPWWLFWFDSVYSGDPRPADIPSVTSLRDSVNWYQDHVFRGFARSWMPLYDIDDSGTLVGNTSTIYYLGAEGFTDSWILNIMRGDLAPTFFGDLTLLTPRDRRFLAATLHFARDESDALSRTKPILGVPGRGEVYGYVARGAEVSFLTVVNPGLFGQSFVVPAPGPAPFQKLLYSNAPDAHSGLEPASGVLRTELGPGEIRIYAYGARAKLSGLSLPAAPTRRYRTITPIAGAFEGKSEAEFKVPAEKAGATLAVIIRYFKGGLPDRSSKQPQDVVKLQGEANGKPVEFETIPREGTDIWSGCSWAVFKHRIAPEDAGHTFVLKLIGTPPQGTTARVTALWLK
jgi:hypothetical protein